MARGGVQLQHSITDRSPPSRIPVGERFAEVDMCSKGGQWLPKETKKYYLTSSVHDKFRSHVKCTEVGSKY